MCLLHVFHLLKLNCGVAHCHFGLRGAEADADLKWVETNAAQMGMPFYPVWFDTQSHASQKGISIQMAARDLRFDFLRETAEANKYHFIVLGTNLNDRAETFLLNLSRGTGLSGLRGIEARSHNLLRPFFETPRSLLNAFARQYQITWREDRSNAETKYQRNKIRHEMLPVLESLNPAFLEGLVYTLRHLTEADAVVRNATDRIKKHALGFDNREAIPLHLVQRTPEGRLFLFDFMQSRGFTPSQVDDVLRMTSKDTGRKFLSAGYIMVLNRGKLEVEALSNVNPAPTGQQILPETTQIDVPLHLIFKRLDIQKALWKKADLNEAFLDFDILRFPLLLRLWKSGDRMRPLGMRNRKKISDILTDNKVSRLDKDKTFVLCSGGEIVWLVGRVLSDDFKITPLTRNVYYCKAEI
jgi:tRNA(Ile)-lysidine synthase